MKNILIANIFGIGDVLFTTPLISGIKDSAPSARVGYLCNARTRDIVSMVPGVEDIFVYEKDELTRLWGFSKRQYLEYLRDLFTGIKGKRYDTVFDFTLSRQFGLFFALCGIPERVGLDYKKRGVFLTRKIPFTGFEGRHVVEYYMDLLETAGIEPRDRQMKLVPDRESLERASEYLAGRGAGEGPLAAIIPGGGASWGKNASRKRWSAEGFRRVSDLLVRQGFKVAIFGDPSERDICRRISEAMEEEPVTVENDLSLKDYAALLSLFDVAVCNDGGPLHMAVALGLKTVSVFGPVDDKVYGPYPPGGDHRVITASEVPCRPCYTKFKLPVCENEMRCLKGIEPETVLKACVELMKRKSDQKKRTP
ncbi:MAG: hypothetical protein GF409_03880 [Candidatus Omnitrophica bacterium]|nr:hypothetical protein [Candidatus Omnitrophota bacterium]